MVQKKSKYGFNSGNTLRQSPRKNTGGIVSCINFDVERLESRLASIWGSLKQYELAEWRILNDILENHRCLFDETQLKISLNKKQGWLKWEALEMSLKKLLQLQAVCGVTHLSAYVQKQRSGVMETYISSSAPYASQGTSDRQAICDLHHIAKHYRYNTRGIQRKVGPQVSGRSRSNAQTQINEYSARYRIQHGIGDVVYEIKDNDYSILPHTKHSKQDVADITGKVYKKKKGVKEKQKYWLLGVSTKEIKSATTKPSYLGISRKCCRNKAAVDTKLSCVSRNSREWKAKRRDDHLEEEAGTRLTLHEMTSALLHGTSSGRKALFAACSPPSVSPDLAPDRGPATSSFQISPTELTYADLGAEKKTNSKKTNTLGETHTEPRHQQKQRRKKRANQNLSWSLFLKLKAASVEKACLKKSFQHVFYDEQSSSPRLFAIDLTNDITNSNVRTTAVQQTAGFPTRNGCQDMSLVTRNSTALLVFELLSGEQCFKVGNGCATAAVQNFHLARMHIRAIVNTRGQTLLCQRLSENLQSHLLYLVSKVVEIFIEVFRNLTADKYQHRLRAAGNPYRLPHALHHSLFDWFYDVAGWQYTTCSQDEVLIATSASQSGTDLHHLKQPTSSQQSTTCVSCGIRDLTFSPQRLQSDPTSARRVTMSGSIKIACCGHRLCLACLTRTLQEYYAAQTLSCLCPVAGCGCSMYSLVLLLGMPLAMYRCHAQRCLNQTINSHPLWHRCPSPHCDRAVMITGTSVLESEIPVECSCGAIWCFHCQAAAHWPASCGEARRFLTSSQTVHDLSLCNAPFLKYTCTACGSHKAPCPGKGPSPQMEGCQCVFRLCQTHVHELGGAPPVTSSKEKVLSMETYRDSLLTLMFHHNALYHHDQKATWHWPEVEVKVMKLARCVARSRADMSDRVRDSFIVTRGVRGHGTIPSPPPAPCPPAMRGDGGHGPILSPSLAPRPTVIRGDENLGSIPSPPLAPRPPVIRRTPSTHRLRPCVVTEQLLLSLLQQFLYQGHFLLEPVFVLLMNRGVRHEPLQELAASALALQAVILQIKQLYSELEVVPSTHQLVVLRGLQEDGHKILLLTAQQAHSLSNTPCCSASAPTTQQLLPGLKSRIL